MMLATKRRVEDGTLTAAGTLSSTLPVANLATDQPGEAARWTSLTGMAIVLELDAAQAINLIALIAHNGTGSATWQIRGATSEANLTASPGYDSGSVSMWPATGRPSGHDKLTSIHVPASAQTFQWWRIDISDGSNPDGYFEAGALIVDDAFQPGVNMAYGQAIGFDDPSEQVRAEGGQTWATPTGARRTVQFTLGFESEADMMGTAYEIDRRRGARKPVFWVFDPAETTHLHRRAVYGLQTALRPIVLPAVSVYEKRYTLAEMTH